MPCVAIENVRSLFESCRPRSRLDLLLAAPYPQCFDAISGFRRRGLFLYIPPPENLTVATTGASGSLFLKYLLLTLERDDRVKTVNFVASDSALRVMVEELGIEGRAELLRQIIGAPSHKIHKQANADIGEPRTGRYRAPADGRVSMEGLGGVLSIKPGTTRKICDLGEADLRCRIFSV